MKRKTAILVGLSAIALIWAALLLPRASEPPASSAPPVASTPEPLPGPEELGALEDEAPETDEPGAPAADPQALEPPKERSAPLEAQPPEEPPGAMGPLDEMKKAYAEDPRDPEAGKAEQRVRDALLREDVPKEMLRSVSCVKSVCKIELSWTPEHQHYYMILMMNLINHISQKLAAEPVGGHQGGGKHAIEAYVSRVEPPFTPPE